MIQFVVSCLVLFASTVYGFPSGAPANQCISMQPKHAGAAFFTAQDSTFRITVQPLDQLTYRGVCVFT